MTPSRVHCNLNQEGGGGQGSGGVGGGGVSLVGVQAGRRMGGVYRRAGSVLAFVTSAAAGLASELECMPNTPMPVAQMVRHVVR